MLNPDYNILILLNSWVGHGALPDFLIAFFSTYILYVFIFILVIYWFLKRNNRTALVEGFITFVVSRGIVTELIRHFYARVRPFIAYNLPQAYVTTEPSSFPSGHMMAMIAISVSVYFYNKKLGVWLFALSVICGFFRIVNGFHYPSDIIGGIIFAWIISWAMQKLWAKEFARAAAYVSRLSDRFLPFTKPR